MEKSKLFKRTAIATALLAPSFAAYATNSPFSALPLHMSGHTVSKASPNVLLVLDNSGSMAGIAESDSVYPDYQRSDSYCRLYAARYYPNHTVTHTATAQQRRYGWATCTVTDQITGAQAGRWNWAYCPAMADRQWIINNNGATALYQNSSLSRLPSHYHSLATDNSTCSLPDADRKSRMETLKDSIKHVIQDPDNTNVRWGVNYINNEAINMATTVPIASSNKTAMLNSINQVQELGGTPFTAAYARAVYDNYVNPSSGVIQYRCQKNFVIGLTDGEANGSLGSNQLAYRWYRDNWNSANTLTYTQWTNQSNGDYGISSLSNIVANKDLRTTTNGADLEGGNWDEDPFAMQNVITSTIGFGIDNNYLKFGAKGDGSAYYTASNADQLSAAFKTLLNTANTTSKNASVVPAVNSSSSTNLGALSLTLDLTKANSTIQFSDLTRVGSGRTSTVTPSSKSIDYGTLTNNNSDSSRRVLLSAVGVAPKFLAKADVTWTGYSDSSAVTRENVVDWLIRRSDKTDTNINSNLRERSETNSPSAIDAKRMMGDVVGSSVLQIGDASSDTANNKQYSPYLVTAANDGMVHIFARQNSSSKPFALKLNWIPGAGARESGTSDATIWDAVQNTTKTNYVTDLNNAHTYLLDGGLSYRQTYNGQIFSVGALGRGGKGAYAFNVGGNQHHSSSTKVGIDANQTDWASSVPLWESGNNAFAGASSDSATWTANQQMGYTVGTPIIDRIATARNSGAPVFNSSSTPIRYIAAVNNGYMGSDALPSLYIYDALGQALTYTVNSNNNPTAAQTPSHTASNAGKLLAKIQVPNDTANSAAVAVVTDNGKTSINNGLSSPTLVDTDFDGLADVAYAGDLNGNLYRFDFRKDSPSQWTAQRVFKGSAANPITAAPSVYRIGNNRLIVMFGTGRDLHSSDTLNTNDQFFYGIYDNLTQDWKPASATCSNSNGCQDELSLSNRASEMVEQTLSQFTLGSTNYRTLSDTRLGSTHRGWFIPLKVGSTNTGERVTVQPSVVDNAVFFTTRVYNASGAGAASQVCSKSSSSGSSWVMGANVLNGGSLSRLTTSFGVVTNTSGQVYYSGYQTAGIASGTNFTYNTSFAPYSRNEQGQAQNGADVDLTESQKQTGSNTNFCGATSSGDLTYADSEDGINSRYLQNRECVIKRISWREIF